MDTLGQQYTDTTNNINTYVGTQLGSFGTWQNTPGSLVQIQASSAGYVWGFNAQNQIYYCETPCTGNWVNVPAPTGFTIQSIQSLQVDGQYVYILLTDTANVQGVSVRPVNGTGSWSGISMQQLLPGVFTTLGVSDTYLWVSGNVPSTNAPANYQCAKPCTTSAWVPNNAMPKFSAMSSSGPNVYGIALNPGTGKPAAYSTPENPVNPQPMPALGGINPVTINGQSDTTNLYVVDSSNTLYGCTPPCSSSNDLYKVGTQGYNPIQGQNSVSVAENNIWMVTGNAGTNGNVFQRLDLPDATTILQQVAELDQPRENIVQQLKNEYNSQTTTLGAQKEVQTAIGIVEDALKTDNTRENTTKERSKLKREIQQVADQKQGYLNKMYPIQILALTLIVSALAYGVLGSFLPATAAQSIVAFLVTVGFGATIYFAVTNNSDGKSAVQSILPTPN
jgi:hypothetical protein